MRTLPRLAIIAVILISSGCYHAVIETGRPPGGERVDQLWARSWVYGLVPPDVVQAGSTCRNGVSRVETRHSFLNQLVGFLTLGIFTPMEIRVACASGGTSMIW
jgi:hypothetical protein